MFILAARLSRVWRRRLRHLNNFTIYVPSANKWERAD